MHSPVPPAVNAYDVLRLMPLGVVVWLSHSWWS